MNGELIFKTVKRNGVVTDFQIEKIEHAIFKTMRAVGNPNRAKAKELRLKVFQKLVEENQFKISQLSSKCKILLRKFFSRRKDLNSLNPVCFTEN